jgi:hypothetical protein
MEIHQPLQAYSAAIEANAHAQQNCFLLPLLALRALWASVFNRTSQFKVGWLDEQIRMAGVRLSLPPLEPFQPEQVLVEPSNTTSFSPFHAPPYPSPLQLLT